MSAAVERFARRWWEGDLGGAGRALSAASVPLSWAWLAAGMVRNLRPAERVRGLGVISVGNLAVGGTGKTPIAGWIVAKLHESSVPTCVLVGGRSNDEAELHRWWRPEVPVLAGSDRIANALEARSEGARVAVLDDGFQHRQLGRDVDVVLLAAEDPFPGRLLPRGPYREAPGALARADGVVITRRVATREQAREVADAVERYAPHAVRAAVHIDACGWRRLSGQPGRPEGSDALAVCAVGRPRSFQTSVARLLGGDVELMDFADHHPYRRSDLVRIRARAEGRPVVVTEKDAVKLRPLSGELQDAYVLSDTLRWEWGEAEVTTLIEGVVGQLVGT